MSLVPSLFGQEEYKEYKPTSTKVTLFIFSYDNETLEIRIPGESGNNIAQFSLNQIKVAQGEVLVGGTTLFDENGLHLGGEVVEYNRIYDTRIEKNAGKTIITFLERRGKPGRASRVRRGNLLSPTENIIIRTDDFVRGILFSVTGDIEIHGEVNRDVISLFGNILIVHGATVRADVATITGKIEIDRSASIYGELFSADERTSASRHRYRQSQTPFSFVPYFRYNRVDGTGLYGEIRYTDADSLLPTFWGSLGYGFESSRGRYELGIEQVISRNKSLTLGGSLYRRLASEDTWLLSERENLFMALLAKEDFKDYYEAEGGMAFISILPVRNLKLSGAYRNEASNWLRARRNIWSLTGGNKLFSRNFRSIPDGLERDRGIAEIDSSTNVTLSALIEFSDHSRKNPFKSSGVAVRAEIEWSDPGFDSDFDYRRYWLEITRYQRVTRHSMFLARFIHGNSDGHLPMHKKYFLGGLGSLKGFDHKELVGTRFWMVNSEYRIGFPSSDLAGLSILYDIAQIANETKLSGDIEVSQDIGFALYLGDDFRISFTKRLDRSHDDGPKIFVRLQQAF